jgi:6-phosphofructokinase 1
MNEIRQALLKDPTIYDFDVSTLGECTVPSPLKVKNFVTDDERASFHTSLGHITDLLAEGKTPASFEKGGPREKIFHDPKWTRAAIVTCGGLCPGINDVIKGIVSVLHHSYKVDNIFGIRYGFRGLIPAYGYSPIELTPDVVDNIHTQGGTILGSSRGEQNIDEMCDTLQRLNINILFCVGGDGTLSGASRIARTLQERKQAISVIGVPKTIDNDLCFIDRTFGFETAVLTTTPIITCAHNEAKGAERGIGLVKLMGRDSGFVAAAASLANSYVNFCLVPEEKFTLHGKGSLIEALEKRFAKGKDHAVIVVAEGAGQELFENSKLGSDKSGNKRKHDIGTFLMEEIENHFAKKGDPAEEVTIKYFNPSYLVRSVPSEGTDAIFCFTLAKYAVHAAMAGKTDMVVGYWGNKYTHIPIKLATMKRKCIDLDGVLWRSVVEATRQDQYFEGN